MNRCGLTGPQFSNPFRLAIMLAWSRSCAPRNFTKKELVKTSGPVDGAVEVRTIKLLANRRMQEQIGGDVPALKEREVALIIALIFDPCGTDPLGVENQKTDRRRKKKVDICSAAKPNRIDYLKHSLFTHTHPVMLSSCSLVCMCV